jgi:rRNA-processing protein FCF1
MELSQIFITTIALAILLETSYLVYKNNNVPRSNVPKLLLDTSVLIDGRIVPLVRSGFLTAELVVMRSVIRELQYMADKADHEKRERARFGLDMIQNLQALDNAKVTIYDDGMPGKGGVDEQLITIAKKLGATICTIDYNLNKVAKVESLIVANVNELNHALRPSYLPGEKVMINIVQTGKDRGQGVGYLDDGTMVVVENGKQFIGMTKEVEMVRMFQTEAGKMMFGQLCEKPNHPTQTRNQVKKHDQKVQPQRSQVHQKTLEPPKQKPKPSQERATKPTNRAPQTNVRKGPDLKRALHSYANAQPQLKQNIANQTPEDSLIAAVNRDADI